MRFAFTDEQQEFRHSVRRFLEKHATADHARATMETDAGWDRRLWERLCNELGVAGLTIPEEFGGFGFGMVEHVALMEVAGEMLLCAPLLGTISQTAALLLASGNDAVCAEWLPRFVTGSATGATAVIDRGRSWDASNVSLEAANDGTRWRLSGVKRAVIDGHTADVIVAAARGPDGLALFVVEPSASGVRAARVPTMDQTRRRATVELDAAPATLLCAGERAERALEVALLRARVALAAEQVGGAQRCLDDAVRYAAEREQFGRPIGSFQAIKHMAADMMVQVESARSAAYFAAWAADAATRAEFVEATTVAAAWCSETYFACAGENIQIHGGPGFTWEYDAHIHFKRATASRLLFGSPSADRESIARQLLDAEAG
jgi:alkylation response protein AidB-like acyl-CoA dehydrogenase